MNMIEDIFIGSLCGFAGIGVFAMYHWVTDQSQKGEMKMIEELKLRRKHRDTYFMEIYNKINEIIKEVNKLQKESQGGN